jgi:hypothetical protein
VLKVRATKAHFPISYQEPSSGWVLLFNFKALILIFDILIEIVLRNFAEDD